MADSSSSSERETSANFTSSEDDSVLELDVDFGDGDNTDSDLDTILGRAAQDIADIDEDDTQEDEDEDEEDEEDSTYEPGIEIEIEETEPNEEGEGSDEERNIRRHRYLLRLLRQITAHGNIQIIGADDDDVSQYLRQRRRAPPDPDRFPKVPSETGSKLMSCGIFGSNDTHRNRGSQDARVDKKKRLTRRLLDRELARDDYYRRKENQRLMAQDMIPATRSDMIIHFDEPAYSGQFSDDGNFFFSVNKDFRVRMYDTSNPYRWQYYKTVEYPFGQWTLTDASLSPDNKYLAYTSISKLVCLAPTDPNDMGDPYMLDLAPSGRAHSANERWNHLGIWSIRFSGDGRRLVAGASHGTILVYDIESRQSLHRIRGHDADVNAVCFGDKSSPHILYSGSDDTTLKVWDTRSMGESRAAGAFIGHVEGLTYIDSKGDGRYILSNGKDQSMKLWDLRMVMSPSKFESIKPNRRATNAHRFDYRWGNYDPDDWYADPDDNSLVTFRGHQVTRTLIRCHFSPPGSTNSRYVYSGSADGKVYVWNMDATLAGKINVYASTKNSRPYDGYQSMAWDDDGGGRWRTCVRDAAWHPTAPIVVASALNGYGSSTGTVSVHSWNDGGQDDEGQPEMGVRVDERLEQDPELYANDRPRNSRRRPMARVRVEDDDDE